MWLLKIKDLEIIKPYCANKLIVIGSDLMVLILGISKNSHEESY